MERTLIILKPDAVQRGLVGEIITRFERKGLQIVGMKLPGLFYAGLMHVCCVPTRVGARPGRRPARGRSPC